MAVNLINSQDITITQTDNDIQLNVQKDSSVSTSSTKPVENQAITNYVDGEVDDLNQVDIGLQNQIDDLKEYSTNEIQTGIWTNGKPLYRKVIECGALPNNANKDVVHNIQNLGITTRCNGMAVRTSDSRALTIPDSTPNTEIGCGVTNTNVYITTHNDRSTFNYSFLILEYTKTTD